MRLRQGTNPRIGSFEVGVCSVYEPSGRPGTVVAQLSVFDPSTGHDEDVVVTAGDEIALGAQRYRVVAVTEGGSGQRDGVEIAAIDGAASP